MYLTHKHFNIYVEIDIRSNTKYRARLVQTKQANRRQTNFDRKREHEQERKKDKKKWVCCEHQSAHFQENMPIIQR